MTETTTVDELDRIDRSIEIDATAERVWALISQPGWWINSGEILSNPTIEREAGDGSVVVVHEARYGDFRIQTVRLDEPRFASFRWLGRDDRPGTLVEFRVEDRPGGVVLHVTESGFSGLSDDRETWLAERAGNEEGWGIELAAAHAHLDPLAVQRSVRIDLPVAQVWPLLTDASRLAEWYAFDGASVDLRVGGAMELTWAEHGCFRAVIETLEAPTSLAFRLSHSPDTDPADGNSTLVTFTVTAVETPGGEVSVVTVRETGFEDLDPDLVTVDDEVEGWEGGLTQLASIIAPAVR